MKKIHGFILIAGLILLSSCSPKISTSLSKNYPPLDYQQEVIVIGLDQAEPDNSEVSLVPMVAGV